MIHTGLVSIIALQNKLIQSYLRFKVLGQPEDSASQRVLAPFPFQTSQLGTGFWEHKKHEKQLSNFFFTIIESKKKRRAKIVLSEDLKKLLLLDKRTIRF